MKSVTRHLEQKRVNLAAEKWEDVRDTLPRPTRKPLDAQFALAALQAGSAPEERALEGAAAGGGPGDGELASKVAAAAVQAAAAAELGYAVDAIVVSRSGRDAALTLLALHSAPPAAAAEVLGRSFAVATGGAVRRVEFQTRAWDEAEEEVARMGDWLSGRWAWSTEAEMSLHPAGDWVGGSVVWSRDAECGRRFDGLWAKIAGLPASAHAAGFMRWGNGGADARLRRAAAAGDVLEARDAAWEVVGGAMLALHHLNGSVGSTAPHSWAEQLAPGGVVETWRRVPSGLRETVTTLAASEDLAAVLEAAAALQDSVLELKRQAIEETLGTTPSAERSPLDYRPEYSAALEAVRASCGAEDSLGASLALRNWHRLLHRELLQAERGEEATRALDELPDAHVADLEPRGALTDLCAEHGLPDPRGALECLAKGEYGGVLAAAEGLERKLREVCEAGGGGEPEQVVVESLDALSTVWG